MNRPVQQSDLAIIIVEDVEYPLVITSVTPQRIIAGDYIIIPTINGWQVEDYDLPHSIKFQAAQIRDQLLTGVQDVDRLILLDLDYKSLIAACSSDQYTNKICQNDFFWQQKVIKDMGQEVMENKLPNMTYREQYQTLMDDMGEIDAIVRGRLDYLILTKLGPDFQLAGLAAMHGRVNILKWAEQHGLILDTAMANAAAKMGKINVLDWLYEKGIYPDEIGIIWTRSIYERSVIEWLLNHKDIPIDMQKIIAHLISDNDTELLDLLESYGVLPDQQNADTAIEYGDSKILKWFIDRGYSLNK